MKLIFPFTLACILAGPSLAQSDDHVAGIVNAWSHWVDAGETSVSTIAVLRNGELVTESSVGVPVDHPMPIASLSKAITASCIAKLIEDESLTMDARLGELIDVPTAMQEITIAQLLIHTSGIWPDTTQNNEDLQNSATEQIDAVSEVAMDRDPQMGESSTFAYNNENYAILGALIQEVTDEPYADFCDDAVLTPLGITSATMEGEWAAHGSWGGWSMSAPDFARFAWATFGAGSDIGTAPEAWPASDLGGGANFGLGVLWRALAASHVFWSSGMLCWDGSGDGGYFASYGGEWLVVTLYSDCLAGTERLSDLDRVLFEAALK